jgi:hypothetical protein
LSYTRTRGQKSEIGNSENMNEVSAKSSDYRQLAPGWWGR